MSTYPELDNDPKTRKELSDWLKRRAKLMPGEPLSPREYLMVQRLQGERQRYAKT